MTRIATFRCPTVRDDYFYDVLRKLSTVAKFDQTTDVRWEENKQKPGHSVIYVDVHEFLDATFESDFRELEGRDCLRLYLTKQMYVMVGVGKSQEECDEEVAAKADAEKAEEASVEAEPAIQFGAE
jgi:hypothetical protein